MADTDRESSILHEWKEMDKGRFRLKIAGRLDVRSSAKILKPLSREIEARRPDFLRMDVAGVDFLDDFGAVMLHELKSVAADTGGMAEITGLKEKFHPLMEEIQDVGELGKKEKERAASHRFFERLGESTLEYGSGAGSVLSFLGAVLIALARVCARPRLIRLGDMLNQMEKTGVKAVPIVALISFLLGLIMAFMSSIQLKQFGANIYVASLVALAMVSELGPIMTAIIVAGRSGSAYAAEIGTMKISEEIDALFTMGFDPTIFLTIPRILASLIVVPILTFFSDLFAIAGGLFIGVTMLNLTTSSYISQTMEVITLFEVTWGLVKSAVFALLIGWTGCMRGFQARGGASAVGNAATSAVVSSIFLIILFDSIFAVIRSYWW